MKIGVIILSLTQGTLNTMVLDHRNILANFQTKILQDKSSMKVYSYNIGKILPKINISEHILWIFLKNFINILAKAIRYKESFNRNISETVCPIWLKFEN